MQYVYGQGNLIEEPQKYFYTQYEGIDFLRAWEDARSTVSLSIGSAMSSPEAHVCTMSLRDLVQSIENEAIIDTAILFENVYTYLIKRRIEDEQLLQALIGRLVKKFEVSKRWYRSYGPGLRACERGEKDAYSNLTLYLRAAEIFEEAYVQWKKLPYLNVLLKSLDTLSSVHEAFISVQRKRLVWLIQREREHVMTIAHAAGISL